MIYGLGRENMRIWQLHFELDKYDSIHLLPITGPELGNIGILAHSVEIEKPLFDTAASVCRGTRSALMSRLGLEHI